MSVEMNSVLSENKMLERGLEGGHCGQRMSLSLEEEVLPNLDLAPLDGFKARKRYHLDFD